MLRKVAIQEGKDWDKTIDSLCALAYREVPQSSTGFSPFELLYGRVVRGPLDVIKETWVAKSNSNDSVISHILAMRDKMDLMTKVVHDSLEEAQMKQKTWYDRNARDRTLQEGDMVLVLLPTSSHKLSAQWQGPYKVEKRVGKVNYVIDMHDRRKRKRVFHINMLREFHSSPSSTAYWTEEQDRGADEQDDIPVWNGVEEDADAEVQMGEKLNEVQRQELRALLNEFRTLFSNKPGRTGLVEHCIETGTARPIRLPPYRIPQAYRDTVKQEIQEMLQAGIIEPSNSEWEALLVLVKKKDGSLRLCVDFRRLKSVSESDAYPMPRIDDLIDLLGKAKYISTLDLTRAWILACRCRSPKMPVTKRPL